MDLFSAPLSAAEGAVNEIPGAFHSGNGPIEQFAIMNPMPGEYTIDFVGVGELAQAIVGGSFEPIEFDGFLGAGETVTHRATVQPACAADLNKDQVVDGADLGALLVSWGSPGAGDLNGSGLVDGADLGILLVAWGPCM